MIHLSSPDEREEFCERFEEVLPYFEYRITFLNRRACLYPNEPCGKRARLEITGMLSVLNALGYEAKGDWNDYNSKFEIVDDYIIQEENERKAINGK